MSTSWQTIVNSFLFYASCYFCLLGPTTVNAAPPPNIVILLADDLGWTDLACYGSDLHQTPNLDALAAKGLRFTNAYAAAPICSPTRAALLTGKSPVRLGMTTWHEASVEGPDQDAHLISPPSQPNLPRTERTLAEHLKEVGYQTFHVGKWHLGNAEYYPETQGFDVNIGGTLWGAPATYFWPYRGESSQELRYVPGLAGGQTNEYLTNRLTDEAVRLLENVGDQPFFLNMWFHAVHTPIEAEEDSVVYYKEKLDRHPSKHHRNPTYAAMVDNLDQNVGRILNKLEKMGVAQNTIIIFTSDNGGVAHANAKWGTITDNAPLRSGKGSLYEGGLRFPLIIRSPQITKPGTDCHATVTTQDFFPTICELLNLSAPAGDGTSLAPLLRDPHTSWSRDTLYWHFPHYYPTTSPVSAIRCGSYKLLHYYEDDHTELYDLASDPSEAHNLAAREINKSQELNSRLTQWLAQVGARFPAQNATKTSDSK